MSTKKGKQNRNPKKKTKKKTKKNIRFYNKEPEQIEIRGYKFLFLPIKNNTFQIQCKIFGGTFLENKNNCGISHLAEHMITNAWDKCYKGGCTEYMEQYGTVSNAHTRQNDTEYWVRGLSNFKYIMIDYILSCVLNPTFTQKTMDREIEAVKNEIKNATNAPDYELLKTANFVFNKNPGMKYSRDRMEQIKNLKTFSLKDIVDFTKKVVKLKKMLFIISGHYKRGDVIKHINKVIDTFPKTTVPSNTININFKTCYNIEKRVVYINNKKNKTAHVLLVFPLDFYRGDKSLSYVQIIKNILSDGLSSLLMKHLRHDKKLVYGVKCLSSIDFCGTVLQIKLTTLHDNLEKSLHEIFNVLNIYKKKFIGDDMLANIKMKNILHLRSMCLNNTTNVTSFYSNQYFHQINKKKPTIYSLEDYESITQNLTKEKVREYINLYFNPETCSVFYMSNKKVNFGVNDF